MNNLSFGTQVLVCCLLGATAYAVFYWFVYSPMQATLQNKVTQRQTLQTEVEHARITTARLTEFQSEVEQKEAVLKTLSRILPSQKEVDDLLRKVQQLAAESSLEVLRFHPEATKGQDFYAEWPITLALDGSYHNLAFFFDSLSRLSRIVNVTNLSIEAKREPTLSSTIVATCTATTFVFIDTVATPVVP